ncbi:MAG TPA: class I SAM-dependent methyltransferase [Vicinamibacterales bacterium]|nr:class I SAM-dependent methyltransferase [Vicinamibacterales bacterium]
MGLLLDAVTNANLNGVRLAMRDRQLAREYWAQSVRRYYELMGLGLEANDPVAFIYEQGWSTADRCERAQLPLSLQTNGITRLDELVVLAMATRALRPATVFEIGTFMGHSTSVLILNAPVTARVYSLDLPLDAPIGSHYLSSDVDLVHQRKVGSFVHQLGLEDRYEQLYGDSRTFDPAPYAGTVELGFIDGAHTRQYVENDTRKMAVMMADRGLVFWHDYGGRGDFRGLTAYLDGLTTQIRVFRVPNTTLAWAPASELRKLAAR